ncbi:MAG: NAD(P)-dependent oxidoreductase [Acidimicrobiales bacterium]
MAGSSVSSASMARSKRRVVIPPLFGRMDEMVPILADRGCEVVRMPGPAPDGSFEWTESIVDEFVRGADALIGTFAGMPLDRTVVAAAERLRVVTSPIIGTEHIDVDACTDAGVVVAFGATPENTVGVAEAVVMLAVALQHQLPAKTTAVADGSWRAPFAGHLLHDATFGLVGFGAISREVVTRLAGWGLRRIVAADPYVDDAEIRAAAVEPVDLDTLLAEADVVSVMVTLTDETRGLIGATELDRMKPGAHVINTARGGVIDESALLDALDHGHLGCAAIDTWQSEGPGTVSPLRSHPKVIATGHNVGHSEELYERHPPAAAENTLRALRGEEPLYVRNPSVLAAWRERLASLDRTRGA